MYNSVPLPNSNKQESFKVKIPSRYITEDSNTFKIKSTPVKNLVNGSNPKTLTVIVKKVSEKKNQTITCNNLTLYENEKKNLNAKVSSNLPLTYISDKPSIATVDTKGNVTGRSKGTAKVTIKQSENSMYNATSKVVTITVKEKAVVKPPTTVKKTYTVVFNPNGGQGITAPQKIEVGKSVKLHANKFKREGYEFVGWATKADMASLPKNYKRSGIKSDFSKSHAKQAYINNNNWYKNINMKHFQLGKVTYKNKEKVKNLTSKGKTITLYAVWKGDGPQAALDWGHIIANEDLIWYGTWHSSGSSCMICHPNEKNSYVCHVFALACYTHGANSRNSCHIKGLNHKQSSWTVRNSKLSHGKFKYIGKPSFNKLKPGDIILRGTHTWIYAGGNMRLESTHAKGAHNNARKSRQIAWKGNAKSNYKDSRVTGVVRFIP